MPTKFIDCVCNVYSVMCQFFGNKMAVKFFYGQKSTSTKTKLEHDVIMVCKKIEMAKKFQKSLSSK